MQWYYSKNSMQMGPVDAAEIRAKLASGEISASDMVWREGQPDWMPVSKVAEFSDSQRVATAVEAAPPSFGAAPLETPYTPPAKVESSTAFQPNIPTYLWQSIVVTLFCCLPFGIVGIIFASKVDGLKAAGNTTEAITASNAARKWITIGAICGVVIWILAIIMNVLSYNAVKQQMERNSRLPASPGLEQPLSR